jgi:hypothetical protein
VYRRQLPLRRNLAPLPTQLHSTDPLNRGTMDVLHLDHDTMNSPPAVARKKAGILDSGLVDYEMVAGVRFELTTFGLCDLTQLSLRVGLYLHPV